MAQLALADVGVLTKLGYFGDEGEREVLRPVELASLRPFIMNNHHAPVFAVHNGAKTTLHWIRSRFWWQKVREEMAPYVGRCKVCQMAKARPTALYICGDRPLHTHDLAGMLPAKGVGPFFFELLPNCAHEPAPPLLNRPYPYIRIKRRSCPSPLTAPLTVNCISRRPNCTGTFQCHSNNEHAIPREPARKGVRRVVLGG